MRVYIIPTTLTLSKSWSTSHQLVLACVWVWQEKKRERMLLQSEKVCPWKNLLPPPLPGTRIGIATRRRQQQQQRFCYLPFLITHTQHHLLSVLYIYQLLKSMQQLKMVFRKSFAISRFKKRRNRFSRRFVCRHSFLTSLQRMKPWHCWWHIHTAFVCDSTSDFIFDHFMGGFQATLAHIVKWLRWSQCAPRRFAT